MPDKQLTLNQQLALLPAAIPDSIVDFLEDFNYATALQADSCRSAFDPDYLKVAGDALKAGLEKLRSENGPLKQVQVDQAGREVPGGFFLKLSFEKGVRGLGVITRLKERTIIKLAFTEGEYDEAKVLEQIRNSK
jgi:hypothetical protein